MKINIQTGKTNKILRKISENVPKTDFAKYAKIAEDMIKFIKNPDNNGVGLAAPQIGINLRFIAVSLFKDFEDRNFKTIYMINPEILYKSEQYNIEEEGCLSVPKVFGKVVRPTDIKVKFFDGKGKENILLLSGLSARVVLHEIDHLNGVLFTDIVIEENKKVANL